MDMEKARLVGTHGRRSTIEGSSIISSSGISMNSCINGKERSNTWMCRTTFHMIENCD